MLNANNFIKELDLTAHPEGGYYCETYRSSVQFMKEGVTKEEKRSLFTSIYFLIEKNNFSAFHRIKSDELWNFHAGDALEIIEITLDGKLIFTTLGNNPGNGEKFQHVVSAGHWFGSRVKSGGEFSLVGCMVCPGFDFRDFEIAQRSNLIGQFPAHNKIISELTRA